MVRFIDNLKILTNESIKAFGTTTAKQARDDLVNEIFPSLSDNEKADISIHTEFDDLLRTIEKDFGDMLDEDDIFEAATKAALGFRREETAREMDELSRAGHLGKTYIHHLKMLTNADLIQIATDKAYELRRQFVESVFPDLSKDEKAEIADKTELDDMTRMLARGFPDSSFQDLQSGAKKIVEVMKKSHFHQKAENEKIRSMPESSDLDWEPF